MGIASGFDDHSAPERGLPALAETFAHHRQRLALMIQLRMDARLRGRIDASDVLQEAYVECARRLGEYRSNPSTSLFLWVRFLTCQKLVDLHRQHLGTKMRDAGREISLARGCSANSSDSLAWQLIAPASTPSRELVRAEARLQVRQALDRMDPLDREILMLRHFEMLSNAEVSQLLSIKKTAASNRYVRALQRLRQILNLKVVLDSQ